MLRDFLERFVTVIFIGKFKEKGGRCCPIFWKNRLQNDKDEEQECVIDDDTFGIEILAGSWWLVIRVWKLYEEGELDEDLENKREWCI